MDGTAVTAALPRWLIADLDLDVALVALTGEQVDLLAGEAIKIDERYLGPGGVGQRAAALAAAYRMLTEDHPRVVARLKDNRAAARLAEAQALAGLRQCAHMIVVPSDRGDRGITTVAGFASAAGMDRQAILRWLGKR